MNAQTQVKKVLDVSQELRARLVALVDSFPEGTEGVKRLSKNCCVVSLSTIQKNGGILVPEYYLGTPAKECLKRIFEETKLKNLDSVIRRIIETKQIPDYKKTLAFQSMYSFSYRQKIRLCPEFIAALEKLWYGEENEIK